jgi:hypothetical protein
MVGASIYWRVRQKADDVYFYTPYINWIGDLPRTHSGAYRVVTCDKQLSGEIFFLFLLLFSLDNPSLVLGTSVIIEQNINTELAVFG